MADEKDEKKDTSSSNITVQRQQYGQTVYLERLPSGNYHETTNPNFGGGISSQSGNAGEGASTINQPTTASTSKAPSPAPKPSETKFPSKEERFKIIMGTMVQKEVDDTQTIRLANEYVKQVPERGMTSDEEYASKMPGGKNFGLGFGYLTQQALAKAPSGNIEVKTFIGTAGGVVPYTIDIGAQAVKNLPEVGKAVIKDPVGFSTTGAYFVTTETGKFVENLAHLPSRALSGETGARGELAGTVFIFGTGYLAGKGAQTRATEAYNLKLAEVQSKSREQVPVGLRYAIKQVPTYEGKLGFTESYEFVLAEKPKGLTVVEGTARATYAKQVSEIKGAGYINQVETGTAELTSSWTARPLAITGKVTHDLGAWNYPEFVKTKGFDVLPENLIQGGIDRQVLFKTGFEQGGGRAIQTPTISPLAERLETRGSESGVYKVEIKERVGEVIKRQDILSDTTELTPAKRIQDIFPQRDLAEGDMRRVRVEYELTDVKNTIQELNKKEIKTPTIGEKGAVFEKEPMIIGGEGTDVVSSGGGEWPSARTALKFATQQKQVEVSIPSGLVKEAQLQFIKENTPTQTRTTTIAYPIQLQSYKTEEYEEYEPSRMVGAIPSIKQVTKEAQFSRISQPKLIFTSKEGRELSITPTSSLNQKNLEVTSQSSRQRGLQHERQRGLQDNLTKTATAVATGQRGITSASYAQADFIVKKKVPELLKGLSGEERRGSGDKRIFRKFKLPKSRYKAGLQPMLTPLEKLRLEIKTKGPIQGLVRSTKATRRAYRGQMLQGLYRSGLLKRKRRR
jgi:hypothetical protein